nr:hypothetical protein B0A51_08920 [Rachicladosporium sp. CCFEE 5018]
MSALIFKNSELRFADRIVLEHMTMFLAPWQAKSIRTITLCDTTLLLVWRDPVDSCVRKLLSGLKHLNIYVELTGQHFSYEDDDTDDSGLWGTVNTESDRDLRLTGIYSLRSLDLETVNMWIADPRWRSGAGRYGTNEAKAPWIERVKGILMGTVEPPLTPSNW